MPIPDPDKIWPKLDELGIDEVRKRLSMGVYAKYKVPIIEEWLRRREKELEDKKINDMATIAATENIKDTRVDKFVTSAKNHPILSVLIVFVVVIIGLSNFTTALDNLLKHFPNFTHKTSLTSIGDSGWLFAGYFNTSKQSFIEGPYVSVISNPSSKSNRYFQLGDRILLNIARKVYIVDFKNAGSAKKLISPITKGIIDKNDETNVILPANAELIVRDVSEGHWPDNPNIAVWLRVIDVPK